MSKRMLVVFGNALSLKLGPNNLLREEFGTTRIHWSSTEGNVYHGELDFLRFKRSEGFEIDVVSLCAGIGSENPDFSLYEHDVISGTLTCNPYLEPHDENFIPNFNSCQFWWDMEGGECKEGVSSKDNYILRRKLHAYKEYYPELEYVILVGGSSYTAGFNSVPEYWTGTCDDFGAGLMVDVSNLLFELGEDSVSFNDDICEYWMIPSYCENNVEDYNTYSTYDHSMLNQFDKSELLNPPFITGRVPFRDGGNNLRHFFKRLIKYRRLDEQTELHFNPEWLDSAIVIGGGCDGTGDARSFDGTEQPLPPTLSEGSLRTAVSNQFTAQNIKRRLIEYGYPDPQNGEWFTPGEYNNWSADINAGFYPGISENYGFGGSSIVNAIQDGVGLVFYRGWGNSSGWNCPQVYEESVYQIFNNNKTPVIFSNVCDTGDWEPISGTGAVTSAYFCLAWTIERGSKDGAVAIIGPTDLDTDTRFNNVLQDGFVTAMLDDNIRELGKIVLRGHYYLNLAFPNIIITSYGADSTPAKVLNFYRHVYNVVGDPSTVVWVGKPKVLQDDITGEVYNPSPTSLDYESGGEYDNPIQLYEPTISMNITDEEGNPVEGVLGALLLDDNYDDDGYIDGNPQMSELLTTEESDINGHIEIDFMGMVDINVRITLWLNKPQFRQKPITFMYVGPVEIGEKE